MSTFQVHGWGENAGVGVSQCAAETMAMKHDKGSMTTQQIDNAVRELI
jgi:hypothetical protein